MKIKQYALEFARQSVAHVLEGFHVDQNSGLNDQQVAEQRTRYGNNTMPDRSMRWWHVMLHQVNSFFVYLFIAIAGGLMLIGEYVNGGIIFGFVIINVAIGFYQEFCARHTLQLLNQYLVASVLVIRNNHKLKIPNTELVPGDIIIIQSGEMICADIRLIAINQLAVDESSLTGESLPMHKTMESITQPLVSPLHATNICFAGTTVSSGTGKGVVVATGDKTTLGGITQLSEQSLNESNLTRGTVILSRFIIKLILITLTCVMIANLLLKKHTSFMQLIVFSTALALSAIPEALPLVITFCLAQGIARLVKDKVIVKRFSAIEDLGAVDVLCIDKTGTITENNMCVSSLYGANTDHVIFYAMLASPPENRARKGFDKAIWTYASDEQRTRSVAYTGIEEVPFVPKRRRNTMLVATSDNKYELIIRGSADDVVACSVPLSESANKELYAWVNQEGKLGRRVLLIAQKVLEKKPETLEAEEQAMSLLGGISFEDPLKESAYKAVKKAERLGVAIKIISGDSADVCAAVARGVGLIGPESGVITGTNWQTLSDDKKASLVETTSVFARILPEQKYEIIQCLQKNHTVGYMGDGINDAPALKGADVSLAVQDAADIACDAADIILLNESLSVIINGIEEGRKVVINTMKYLKTTLSTTFGNFYALAISSLFVDYLPMLPMHILMINLLTDLPMIAISTDTVGRYELKHPKKYDVVSLLSIATLLGIVSTIFDFICFVTFSSISAEVLQTNWFIMSVLTGLVFIFSIRTPKFFLYAPRPSWALIGLSITVGLIVLTLPNTYIGQTYLKFTPVSLHYMLLIFAIVIAYFVTTELVKWLYYRRFNNSSKAR